VDAFRFGILGLGAGGVYALLALGVVLVYRGSGVLNFAQGAIGMTGAFVFYSVRSSAGWNTLGAGVVALAFAAALGVAIHLGVMQRLRDASGLAPLVAMLAIWMLLRAIAAQTWGFDERIPERILPSSVVSLPGHTFVGVDRLIVSGLAVVLTLVLSLVYRFTRFGIATEAVADNAAASATIGISPNVVAAANWALGSMLATLGGILIVPISGLQIDKLIYLVIPALAAALVGGFRSYWLTLLGGLGLGIAQSETSRYVTDPAWSTAGPFIAIIVVLVLRGRALPVRGAPNVRAPQVGTGHVSVRWVCLGVGLLALTLAISSGDWLSSLTTTFTVGLVVLSIVVVTGYCGQLSLAQFAVAGMGAWSAARLVVNYHLPIPVAALIAVCSAAAVGMLIAVAAIRTRGMNLAVVTLGLAVVIEALVFTNPNRTGGITGTNVGDAHLFGWNISGATHPGRYAILATVLFVIASLGVANIRRGASGRRFLAVRANERGAAALGISVAQTKMISFAMSAAIASVGGVLAAFRYPNVTFDQFALFQSIYAVVVAVLGGVGFVLGALIGACLVPGSIGTQVGNSLFGSSQTELQIIVPALLLVLLRWQPDGLAKALLEPFRRLRRQVLGRRFVPSADSDDDQIVTPGGVPTRVLSREMRLRIEDLSVRFGSTQALENISFQVRPGEVVGVIGANGAGKTTLIDAVTGFVTPTHGRVVLGETDITNWSADRRARGGVSRSFQSLELFDGLTVMDNLRAACDTASRLVFITDLVRPSQLPLSPVAWAAVHDFGLADSLSRRPDELSYGTRRLLAIARSVATSPSVLLLDEPAAGLDEKETAELSVLIRRLAREWRLAVVVVEHDMSLVLGTCDRIEVLDHGRHMASGTPEEIRRDPRVVDAYLGAERSDEAPESDPSEGPVPRLAYMRTQNSSERPPATLLRTVDLSAGYGDLPAIRHVDLEVRAGEVLALIGSNGAGKSTTLRALAGQLRPLAGEVQWNDRRWTATTHQRARQGLAFVPEGRSVFANLSVSANLRLGRGGQDRALVLFPELESLRTRRGGLLSGGEQQILAVARALAADPTVLLADELSIGLAPKIVDRLFGQIRRAADLGLGAVVVDQSVERVLAIADRVVVLNRGTVVLDEPAAALRGQAALIFESFLGTPVQHASENVHGAHH